MASFGVVAALTVGSLLDRAARRQVPCRYRGDRLVAVAIRRPSWECVMSQRRGSGVDGVAEGASGGHDSVHDPLVASTPAENGGKPLADLSLGRLGVGAEQVQRRH